MDAAASKVVVSSALNGEVRPVGGQAGTQLEKAAARHHATPACAECEYMGCPAVGRVAARMVPERDSTMYSRLPSGTP